ncbi:MAG TPA: prolyl-tRNA synthetase associated domain-containing protein [Gammaproteobacteria bacterium]|jgi:Ala-tRNA(Pro) deacylase|nr:DNA-binding protein [Acidiferrobacteraceae bacterium]MDP6397625.1 prolyl-tRNA synthetase associated domain-containing protein [Arenicellales bacterium]HCX86482.1 prolyl-tRNA synthetase associated domain-containing protein [Gammaproteobacteria bacterium]MDP6551487.1 prolyl-tRNA synthetase associated domain-containing protein [Arenicellales bacterium]MDP6790443.1 prolyl-tRNA synthetase associated domain-containing protein [Arenicellales bacterium]|tara:strand:- start:526 stop:1116 length:591 start_codon:yes stop_codon:yes gene_type:complete
MNACTDVPDRLIDGSRPKRSDALLDELASLGINAPTTEHAPMFTVEDSKTLRVTPGGQGDIKNLFLRNQKGRMWLVSCHEDRNVDLKVLAKALGAGRFSFASETRLMQYLGVTPGAVSPLALVNDKTGAVQFMVDRALTQTEVIYLHPLINTRTTTMATSDLLAYCAAIAHQAKIITFEEGSVHCKLTEHDETDHA